MRSEVDALTDFARQVRAEGIRHIVLLGMGGSSLGAEVIRQCFGPRDGWPELVTLDSTLPDQINRVADSIDIARALFIVSSKSGATTEPNLLYRLFRQRVDKLGGGGERFVAVTDPGSPLEDMARRDGFRKIFLNAPDVCGRYSVLSYFGIVPAALAGYDIAALLDSSDAMRSECAAGVRAYLNPGAWLGTVIASLAASGRDKLTILTSPTLDSFGLWAEQLVAESLGKNGVGIAPVVAEPLANVARYGLDRQFVYMKSAGEDSEADSLAAELATAGHPVIRYKIDEVSALGSEFYRWEFAVAHGGRSDGRSPFRPARRSARQAPDTARPGVFRVGWEAPDAEFTGFARGTSCRYENGRLSRHSRLCSADAGERCRAVPPESHDSQQAPDTYDARLRSTLSALDRPTAQGRPGQCICPDDYLAT